MAKIALKWGIALGVAICIWTAMLHVLGWYTTDLAKGQRADQVVTVLPLVFLYLAIREYSRRTGRAPKLVEAIGMGTLTGLFSLPVSSGFLWIYHHNINPQWLDLLVAYQRQRLVQSGATPEAIQLAAARLISSGTDRAQLLGSLVGTILLSVLISVLVWALMRFRSRRA